VFYTFEIHVEYWLEGVQDDSITVNSTPSAAQAECGQDMQQALTLSQM